MLFNLSQMLKHYLARLPVAVLSILYSLGGIELYE